MLEVPSFKFNSKFPQLCNKVTVEWDKKRGRYVKALENIPMGTVVCVEQGITVNVDVEKCYRCLRSIENTEYAYCKNCQDFYEPDEIACGEFDELGIFKLAAHLVFYYPFIEIAKLVQSADPEPPNCAPGALSTSDISSVYQLTPFQEIGETFKAPEIQDAIGRIVKSLESDKNWGRMDFTVRWVTFTKALRIIAERCAKNAHAIYSIEQKDCKDEEIPLGTGLFPIASIFNHSCTPNVSAFFIRNTFIFVSHGVSAGEELVDSYGVTYHQHTLKQRSDFLESVSGFKCHCQSCADCKSLDRQLSRGNIDVEKCSSEADSLLDISEYLEDVESGNKTVENLIVEFARRCDSDVYTEKMFQLWKQFVANCRLRGIKFDPYLIRAHIEMTLLVWNDEVECSEEEKASILFVAHRSLRTFYAGLHPLSQIVENLFHAAVNHDLREIRSIIEQLTWAKTTIWKRDERPESDSEY